MKLKAERIQQLSIVLHKGIKSIVTAIKSRYDGLL